jgi:hypothetical protein
MKTGDTVRNLLSLLSISFPGVVAAVDFWQVRVAAAVVEMHFASFFFFSIIGAASRQRRLVLLLSL